MITLLKLPYIGILIIGIIILVILIFRLRKIFFAELKRWQPKELSLGPLKIERKEKGISYDKQIASQPVLIVPPAPMSSLPELRYTHFIGREAEIEACLASLRDPYGKRLIGLFGMGGIGKSALAREIIERLKMDRTFSAFWWTTAKQQTLEYDELSADAQVSYEILFNRLIAWLGLSAQLHKETRPAIREATVQKSLRSVPVLLVLDNLETAQDQEKIADSFAHLLKDTPSRIILTSREAWEGVKSTLEPHKIKGLEETDAIQLMRDTARENKMMRILVAKDDSLYKIVRAVGCMPLALKLTVGLLDNLDVDILIENLKKIHSEHVIELYEYLFANTWRALGNEEKDVLIAISTFDEEEGARARYLREAKIVSDAAFLDILEHLRQMSLIEVSGGVEATRYTIHPLMFNFIRSQSE